jgi:hypothetical protein
LGAFALEKCFEKSELNRSSVLPNSSFGMEEPFAFPNPRWGAQSSEYFAAPILFSQCPPNNLPLPNDDLGTGQHATTKSESLSFITM